MRRFRLRTVAAIAVGAVCLVVVVQIVWALRGLWIALGRGALEVEWEIYTTVAMLLGVAVAAQFASRPLDDLREHRWTVVGCAGTLLYGATRFVMWLTYIAGGVSIIGLIVLIVLYTILLATGA